LHFAQLWLQGFFKRLFFLLLPLLLLRWLLWLAPLWIANKKSLPLRDRSLWKAFGISALGVRRESFEFWSKVDRYLRNFGNFVIPAQSQYLFGFR